MPYCLYKVKYDYFKYTQYISFCILVHFEDDILKVRDAGGNFYFLNYKLFLLVECIFLCPNVFLEGGAMI